MRTLTKHWLVWDPVEGPAATYGKWRRHADLPEKLILRPSGNPYSRTWSLLRPLTFRTSACQPKRLKPTAPVFANTGNPRCVRPCTDSSTTKTCQRIVSAHNGIIRRPSNRIEKNNCLGVGSARQLGLLSQDGKPTNFKATL